MNIILGVGSAISLLLVLIIAWHFFNIEKELPRDEEETD